MRLTRRPLAVLFALELAAFAFLAMALLDRRLHQRDPVFGINQWGYRAEARGAKEPGEIRVALIGGSAAFEAGTPYHQTLAGQLFLELRQAGGPLQQQYSVVNLSEPRVGADSYVDTLRAYEYLQPDVVIVFDGYDALGGIPAHARRRSAVFLATGYLPILPAVLLGGQAWLSDPDGGVVELLQGGSANAADVSCASASASYCAGMAETVRFGLAQRRPVIVVSPPSVSSRHARQQNALAQRLAEEFGREPRFRYVDVGPAIDLSDRVLSPDGLHRTEIGNHEIAWRIAAVILRSSLPLGGSVSGRAGDSQ